LIQEDINFLQDAIYASYFQITIFDTTGFSVVMGI